MNKKKNNIFLKIMGFLFIIFMGLYVASASGYYESKIRNKTMITDEGLKEFEKKISNGEEIDLNSYIVNTREDYSSKMSLLGDIITNKLEYVIDDGAKIIIDILKSLF